MTDALVIPGQVFAVVERPGSGGPRIRGAFVGPRSAPVPAYILDFPGRRLSPKERNIRGAVWRLHADVELLREAGRRWNPMGEGLDGAALGDLLNEASRRLVAARRDGVDQPVLLALVESLEGFDRTELRELADSIGQRSKGLARRLELILERSAASRANSFALIFTEEDVVVGDKNEFNFTGPASGIFGSHIRSSADEFHAASSGDLWQRLDRELSELVDRIDGERRDEVLNLQQELADSSDEQKRSILPRIQDHVKTWGPAVAPLLAIINQILGTV